MSIIEAKQLTKIFGSHPEQAMQFLKQGWTKERILKETRMTVGVNQASFSIEAGQIFVIMGLSGSGKSTLIRLLNRLIEPTSGQLLFEGRDIVQMSAKELRQFRRKKMGMVFQKFALFPHRTVLQNVEYGLEIQGIEKQARKAMAEQALQLVGLNGWENSYPDQLSGGMQQRVGLARGLANDPDILLMDEAFSALDPLIRKDMQDELLQLQSAMKKTIIFITHDLDEALRIGDKIALMKDGVIVQIGTPDEILINPATPYVEKFIEDVDLSKVLTAAHVMRKPATITLERGPRVALQLMKEQGVSSLYVTDKGKKLLGVITAELASAALKENLSIGDILIKEVPSIDSATPINELFEPMAASSIPLAVTDDTNRLLGIVIRGAVFAALAGNAIPEAGGAK
ncbi:MULTISPECIES: glycine betaine/L-proline ABC transporter ATP-binding protein [unclassified Paenibacillus]|uniref:quaternary amine ABC transporter ATP-binding protein n=1 Tax=unclassified Paenibacillus TaxID=185978 RepID=UPI0010452F42|nr:MULTISPECIES: glycine betaine/L-proline ABC transporter ATP-binding protein [unclassified Paenibacillus]NIK69927.1 glycine betaine/proline transport system ATP-binding protein [Paenibacillus sp. BK720]TCM97761.1 glycine betaine/proline transport system ATP-binding protein [Paenibacillus sp. BK033]